jgi:hypothetical protein
LSVNVWERREERRREGGKKENERGKIIDFFASDLAQKPKMER